MARLLKKLGQIPSEATDAESGIMRFEADEIAGLIKDFETAVEMKDAPVYIGASKSQFQAIYASGLIEPLIPRDAPGAIRRVVFSRRHLDDFIAQVERLPLAERNCDQLISISDACQRGAGATVSVLRRILTGDLPAWRREGPAGLAKVVVLRPALTGAG